MTKFESSAIQHKRKQLGMTQIGLSIEAGINLDTLRAIERGKTKNPGIITIKKICNILNLDIDYLFITTQEN